MFEKFRLRQPVEAYEVVRISDGRREFVVNGGLVIEAELFRKLFVPETAEPPAPLASQQQGGVALCRLGRPRKDHPAPGSAPRPVPQAANAPSAPASAPRMACTYSDLVLRALKVSPMTNQELRTYISQNGDPHVGSDTVASVVNGLRRRNKLHKQDHDLRWAINPTPPDVSGEELPGLHGAYRDAED